MADQKSEEQTRAEELAEEKKQDEELRKAAHEVGERAQSESGMVISQAQRLFYEVWNQHGLDMSIDEGKEQFDRCIRMAEEIRKICAKDFRTRFKRIKDEFEKEHTKLSPDGKRRIIITPSEAWQEHRFNQPGQIQQ